MGVKYYVLVHIKYKNIRKQKIKTDIEVWEENEMDSGR